MQRIHKKRMIMIISIIIGSILFVFLLGKLVTFVGYSIDVKAGMLNYLENKYDQEFECLSFSGHDWFAQPADMMVAYPKGTNPDETKFKVIKIHKYGTGKNYASDAYFGVLIRPEYEKFASEIAAKYFDEFKLYVKFNTNRMSDELGPDSTLEDMFNIRTEIDTALNMADVYINVPDKNLSSEEFKQKLTKLAQEFADKKIIVYFSAGIYKTDYFNTVNKDNWWEKWEDAGQDNIYEFIGINDKYEIY